MQVYRFQEIVLGILGILWGVWLVVFDTYTTSPVLMSLRLWHVPEWLMIVWPSLAGAMLLVLGRDFKWHIHLVMCCFWLFITVAIAETNITLTAVPIYATVGILHAGSGLLIDRKSR